MRSNNGLTSYILRRALNPLASNQAHQSSSSSNGLLSVIHQNQQNYNLQKLAFYSKTSKTSSSGSKWWLPHLGQYTGKAVSVGIAGAVSFSILASSLTSSEQDLLAKEPPKPEFLPQEVVLYQYEACPFCNKVKAFLDYYDIPYKVVEVNPLSKKEIKWSEYKKVPILTVDGEHLVDSSDIIDKMGAKIHPKKSVVSDSDGETEEKMWRRWVDSHLVHVLSPNIYRNSSEALESFDYITSNGNFSYTEKLTVKYAGAVAMYFVSKKLKKKYNITDERAALYEAAETWVDALDGREFLGGPKPNLADLAVFGVLRPIRYLRSGKDMVEHTRIGDWYSRMEGVVGDSCRIKAA